MNYNTDGDYMFGIDMNKEIKYLHSSLRFFDKNERHISRFCNINVLLLVFDGVLRFSEDGIPCEVATGQYYIQRKNLEQTGDLPCDEPKYLYVHFDSEWTDSGNSLPQSGTFKYSQFEEIIKEMDYLSHNDFPYIVKSAKFYEILARLYETEPSDSLANKIAFFIQKEYQNSVTLELLCEKFNFSKNHIINNFKKEFGVTPITYLNNIRLKNAEHLIEATSDSIENIAADCGYQNYSHFYRQFVRKNNISPEKFRDKKRMGVI